jgi:dihydroflavonol-4-reductase
MLGSRICRLLAEQGARVRATYRPGDATVALEGVVVEHRPADLLDEEALARAMEGAEVVFHAAALVSFNPRLYSLQMRVNAGGTDAVLRAAVRAGVRRLIHTSTVNTLGVPKGPGPGDESTAFDWGSLRLGYMDSKKAAEDRVLAAAGAGLDAVCVLPGTLFGPGDVNFNAGTYVRAVATGWALIAPPGGTTAAHVDDVAGGHLLALERGRRAERYVLGGDPISYRDLFAEIARALGRRPPVATAPAIVLRATARLAPFAGVLAAASAKLYYSSAKAQRELGWTWRPVREAVEDAVAWYRERGIVQ